MEGNTLTRSLRGIAYMVRSPRDAVRWVRGKVSPSSPIKLGLPWVSWGAIDRLEALVRPGMRVFEWGGGGSTLFWLGKGCHVTTVESSEFWLKAMKEEIAQRGWSDRAEMRLVEAEKQEPALISRYVQEVHQGKPWDIVLVDGLEESYVGRVACLREIPGKGVVNPGGFLVLDDAWRENYQVTPSILDGWKRETYRGLGPCRPGVTQTDIYHAPK